MSTVADITHMPIVMPHRDPDAPDPDLRAEAEQAASDDYINDWCRGDLYDDGDTYARPIEALAESHGELLQQMLDTYRHGDHAELEGIAGTLCRALEGHIKDQAGDL